MTEVGKADEGSGGSRGTSAGKDSPGPGGGKDAGVIVVGVDGSESSIDALRWAARQAGLTGSSLHIFMTWEYLTSYGWVAPYPEDANPEADAKQALQQVMDDVLGTSPEIDVKAVVIEGHPAPILLKAAHDADLLVVGSRGRGGFSGLLLGSVSRHVVTHAPCPVVIVRHPS